MERKKLIEELKYLWLSEIRRKYFNIGNTILNVLREEKKVVLTGVFLVNSDNNPKTSKKLQNS